MATKSKGKVVGVRFHLTHGRTREITQEEHGKKWEYVASEYEETNGANGHKQILSEEDVVAEAKADDESSSEDESKDETK